MSDQAEKVIPWTIKGIGPEARNAAIAAAKRERQPLGEWMTRAIRAQIQSDRQQGRPLMVVQPLVDPALEVPVGQEEDAGQTEQIQPPPKDELREIERTVAMIRELADSGAEVPKTVARSAYAVVRERLQAMRGPTARGRSKTSEGESLTEEATPAIAEKEQV